MIPAKHLKVRHLGILEYLPTWQAMKNLTNERKADTIDEIWVLQHPPVYTLGQAGKAEHILNPGEIPVIKIDRGGQVTYHGPGQIIVYLLVDLKRKNLGPRQLVNIIEQSIIQVLANYGLDAELIEGAPGVFVGRSKIASLGLRIRRGCSFHGLAFNFDMDLTPFQGINPCGYENLEMTQLSDLIPNIGQKDLEQLLLQELIQRLGYNEIEEQRNTTLADLYTS